MSLSTSIHFPPSPAKISPTSFEENPPLKEENALHRFQELLYAFLDLIQENRQLLSSKVDEHIHNAALQTKKIQGMMDSKGLTALEIAATGAVLASLAAFIPHLDKNFTSLNEIFDSLGGPESIKKLLESSAQFTEGTRPVFSTWDEAKMIPEQEKKDILQDLKNRGDMAVRQRSDAIPQLLHIADDIRNKWGETRYRG